MRGQYKYREAALGGTFDRLHRGHRELLSKAFATSRSVIIGLTSDEFAKSSGKKIEQNFEERRAQLKKYLDTTYPGRDYQITKLESTFGPAIFTREIEGIIVSTETLPKVENANQKRREAGLPDLQVEVVPMVLADDDDRISSTRIRAGEIDEEGRLLK